jgi:diadenosine tetraphosphate (Ap4A) HIT family hydrolase
MLFTPHPQIEKDSIFVHDLPLCQVRLQNQSAMPWLVLLPRREGLTELHQLDPADRQQAMEEIAVASRVLQKAFAPDKINVGALGNIVSQLHIHVIGRFKNDPAWPQPVWGNLPTSPYTEQALLETIERLKNPALWQ